MDKKKKGLLIFISILITGIILFRFFIGFDKNNELNGDYYLYFKFSFDNSIPVSRSKQSNSKYHCSNTSSASKLMFGLLEYRN